MEEDRIDSENIITEVQNDDPFAAYRQEDDEFFFGDKEQSTDERYQDYSADFQQQMNSFDYYEQVEQNKGPGGLAITALVFGILSITCCCCTALSIVLGLVGVILSIIGFNKQDVTPEGRNMLIAALVCSIVGILIGGICFLLGTMPNFLRYIEKSKMA